MPVAIAATAGVVIPPSDRRVALVLPCHQTVRYSLGVDGNLALDAGFNIPANNVPTQITIEDIGDLIQKGFYGIASAPITIGVIEVIQEEV
jgi:hypothetical protein